MLSMRKLLALCVCLSFGLRPVTAVEWRARPTMKRAEKAGHRTIHFELSRATDVEVAILDKNGRAVRHLAAGVLGGANAPPLPLKPGLAQALVWDGKDDYGSQISGLSVRDKRPGFPPSPLATRHLPPFRVRVRVGMGVKLEKIVGGDPYAFFSRQSGGGDHFQWKMAGIEAKADGMVYVMGNTTFYGSQVIRQYDGAGNYVKTVFPPPADRTLDEVKGWGVYARGDGTFTMRNNADGWKGTGVGTTGMSHSRYGKIVASFVASPEQDSLDIRLGNSFFTAGTDGTLREYKRQALYGDAKLPPKGLLRGPCYTALSPDGRKYIYVSGIHSFSRKRSYGRVEKVDNSDFWRDGQVWKIDRTTGKLSVFFALDEKTLPNGMRARSASPIGDHDYINPCTAFHGVAVDSDGRVFVCDRLNKRVAVLDKEGKLIAELPVQYPDAIGISPRSKAVYVTTRYGSYGNKGKLQLLKFNDWSKDKSPAAKVLLRDRVGKFSHHSTMAVVEHKGQVLVWVVYTTLPVRIYRDAGSGMELHKDFYEAGPQRAMDLQHMQIDRKTGHVYIDDAAGWCFRLTDWKSPEFKACTTGGGKGRLGGSSIAIDHRNRYLYAQSRHNQPVCRYTLDGDMLRPASAGDSGNKITAKICFGWGFNGLRPKGMAVCPDGALVTVGNPLGVDLHKHHRRTKGTDYGGYVYYWKRDENKAPWQPTYLGTKSSAGVRFDPQGNMYLGVAGGKHADLPKGYAREKRFFARVYKYAPTRPRPGRAGSLKDGCLYPTAPAKPARAYEVHLSPIGSDYKTPRFGVDEYGRIYYPSGIESRVGMIDNAGNRILWFGTYGNRDSMAGLDGELVPTKDIPMAWPNSVDADDDYIYVTDIINTRLLRIRKTFVVTENVKIN